MGLIGPDRSDMLNAVSRHVGYAPVPAAESSPPSAAAKAVAERWGVAKTYASCLLWLVCSSTIIIINKYIMVSCQAPSALWPFPRQAGNVS